MAGRLALLNALTSLAAAAAVGFPALKHNVPAEDVAVYAIVVAVAAAALQGALALSWWVLSDRAHRRATGTGSSSRSVRHLAAPPE